MAFVHLHLHTDYSFMDGILTLPKMLAKVKDDGMAAVAVTDHGNMHAALPFYQKARDKGIKPIIGCEGYFVHDPAVKNWETMYHLTLLAMNDEGYRNLVRMVSLAHEHFWHRPRITPELLKKYAKGIMGMSACIGGELPQLVRNEQDISRAVARATELADIFDGNFRIEIMRNGYRELDFINRDLMEISRTLSIPIVATNDVHYLEKDDWKLRRLLSRNEKNRDISEANGVEADHGDLWLRTQAEMEELFSDIPEALEETVRVADLCNVEIELGKHYFPNYQTPDAAKEIREKAWAGLKKRGLDTNPRYVERLESELKEIIDNSFDKYLLIVADFVRHAREAGIPVGPGRGSAAGSLVVYCLEITDLDPLPYNLLFERFINTQRVSLPDIDMDFCERRRGEMIAYAVEKYGVESVAQIVTYNKMQARQAVKDVARALGMLDNDRYISPAEAQRIANVIPEMMKIPKGWDSLIAYLRRGTDTDAFADICRENPLVTEVLDYAEKAEGLARGTGVHAAGIVIAPTEILDFTPTWVNQKKSSTVVTQYDMSGVETVGLVKMDFLGLKNMTVIDLAVKNIAALGIEPPDMRNLPLDDAATFDLYASGDMEGVFQMESEGMRKYLAKLQPKRFEDLIAVLALYRPGPLGSGMADNFVERRNGREEVTYFDLDDKLKTILEPTCGVIVYQEQVMQIAQSICGFSLGEADILRRAMGKKKPEVMKAQRAHFVESALEHGTPEDKAVMLFDMIEKFAEYGFNKSHSAAYALISYQTAYLKSHYYAPFMAALMEVEDTVEKVGQYVAYAKKHCKVFMPDVLKSGASFAANEEGILFGLSAIKGVPDQCVRALEGLQKKWRKEGAPRTLVALLAEDPSFNLKFLEAMNMAGAFDSFMGSSRWRAVIDENKKEIIAEAKKRRGAGKNSMDLFGGTLKAPKAENPLGMKYRNAKPWDLGKQLENEFAVLGFYASNAHPVNQFEMPADRVLIRDIKEESREDMTFCVMVEEVNIKRRKSDDRQFATGMLSDESGRIPFACWTKEWEELSGKNTFFRGGCYLVRGTPKIDKYNSVGDTVVMQICIRHFEEFGESLVYEKTNNVRIESGLLSDACLETLGHMLERVTEAPDEEKIVFLDFLAVDEDFYEHHVAELSGLVTKENMAKIRNTLKKHATVPASFRPLPVLRAM